MKDSLLTDAEVVKRILAGDTAQFGILVKRYKAALHWIIHRIVGNFTDTEDIVIESFTKAYENLHTYSIDKSFSNWLFAIGSNRAIDFVRLRNRQPNPVNNPVSLEEEIMTPVVSTDASIEDIMISEELTKIIDGTIIELRPFHRTLIDMRYYKGMTYDEIAKKLNKPVGTIKTGLHRAKKILYKLMKDNKNLTQ